MSNELNYQEEQITKLLSELNSTFDDIRFRESHGFAKDGDLSDLEDNFEFYARNLFIITIAYLENKGFNNLLLKFEKSVTPYYDDRKKLFDSAFDERSGEDYSLLIGEYWRYLAAFPAFNANGYEQILIRTGLVYLEHILESTAVIISELGQTPTSETDVYNCVKVVCMTVFPNYKQPSKTIFQQTAKWYKPDILLPSLNCAIEYKYAATESRLIETIDQILIDVVGYANNDDYKLFYAVFYVKPGIWTKQRFYEVWNEKKFPKNWKGVFVEGLSLPKKKKN